MSALPSLPNRRTVMTVAAVVVVLGATSRPVRQGAETVLLTTLIVAAVVVGVAALAVVAFIVIRSHRRQARARAAQPSLRAPAVGRPVAAIPAPPLLAAGETGQSLMEALGLDETERDLARP
jgi:hypothetical protein